MIHTHPQNHEYEERGEASLELVAVRYTGPQSSTSFQNLGREASWMGTGLFQGGPATKWRDSNGDIVDSRPGDRSSAKVVEREPGPWQLGLVPDWTDEDVTNQSVVKMENKDHLEVAYDKESIAEAVLEHNRLPRSVFSREFDDFVRARVFEKLDLEDIGVREEMNVKYREQLSEITGDDFTEEEQKQMEREDGFVQELQDDYPRSDLMSAASELGKDETNIGKSELAEWLAQNKDKDEILEVLS